MDARGCCAPLLLCATLLVAGCGSNSSSGNSASASNATTSSSTTSNTSASSAATSTASSSAAAAGPGFEGVPIEQGADLASTSAQTSDVDGISCAPVEQLAYHIHAHLSVYVNGSPSAVPGGIGIPGSVVEATRYGPIAAGGACIYWLHTHAPDGVIHIESPFFRVYTLGNFFDIWRQPLSATQVAGATGKVTALVDGKQWTRSPRLIPLLPHSVIQLDVGSPVVPFQAISWGGTRL